MLYSKLVGWGSYLPQKIISNNEMIQFFETSDEWIQKRTGITKRHVAGEGEYTSDLGYNAALKAIEVAGLHTNDIDMIIVATTTPDRTFPSTASIIQNKLKAYNAFAMDIQAVCSGFVYALSVADHYIKAGTVKNILIIGAETMSRILDWTDRGTAILFGDGAGAFIIQQSDKPGILGTKLFNDGRFIDDLYTSGGVSMETKVGFINMNGREIYVQAVEKMGTAITHLIDQLNIPLNSIQRFIPHQANIRIIQALAERFNIDINQFVISVDQHANTSAASIPLAFCHGIETGQIQSGQRIALTALGGGLTWGSAIIDF
jgi:3-oxoacyl-[acyl-carrier-protein] synthase-3